MTLYKIRKIINGRVGSILLRGFIASIFMMSLIFIFQIRKEIFSQQNTRREGIIAFLVIIGIISFNIFSFYLIYKLVGHDFIFKLGIYFLSMSFFYTIMLISVYIYLELPDIKLTESEIRDYKLSKVLKF